jgi:hypothetical protein
MAVSGGQEIGRNQIEGRAILPWISQQRFLEKLNHVLGALARQCRQPPSVRPFSYHSRIASSELTILSPVAAALERDSDSSRPRNSNV